jgi:protein-S-isoprenylcysteine O-methyltransferase Ste14
MENKQIKSLLLPGLQFLFIALLLATTTKAEHIYVAAFIITLAIALAAWAIYSMRKSRLRISPVPAEDAILITSGPYRFIRHPMYASILTGTGGLLVLDFSWVRLLMAVVLFVVLLYKLLWEESMLVAKFPAYEAYRQKTKKLLPYLF